MTVQRQFQSKWISTWSYFFFERRRVQLYTCGKTVNATIRFEICSALSNIACIGYQISENGVILASVTNISNANEAQF